MLWMSYSVKFTYNSNVESPFKYHSPSSVTQLLCRVKDSSTLLQKRMTQERNQEQRDRDTLTLATYKVFCVSQTHELQSERASHGP